MKRDPLEGFSVIETIAGWRYGSTKHYPDTGCVACPCGHLSTRDRNEVPEHVCPACGRGPS